jgi:CubicO group peptidase (beta-lactamase class C family)
MRRHWPRFLLLLPIGTTPLRAQQSPPGLDSYIQRVMQTFTVPGLSVAIVKDGKVVLAKGYGVRRMGDGAPVDARTRFGIASNTKLFTATALTLLVEEARSSGTNRSSTICLHSPCRIRM